ncbi:MAG TPA: SUMF1/EgtB/PvdO family nonheme iron enzyme, partial [Spirochaetota bacterium]|nr:SUMF1/EgtB/PvdO family nonheme iron enzyme [Spirochaetota bacterium]
YDMSGNVWEWCYDISGGSNRVIRGGAYYSFAFSLQVGRVDNDIPYNENSVIGFRFCRTK